MFILLVVGTAGIVTAQEEDVSIYPTAILPFQERGSDVRGHGEKVSDLLFASLATHERVVLVDREDIDRLLQELELNLSGMVGPGQATQVGQMTGAKVLVTGSVMEADGSFHIVAKIIATETSRVLGASVKGPTSNGIAHLVEELAAKIAGTIEGRAPELVGKKVTVTDRIFALKEKLGDEERPTVAIEVDEQHIGRAAGDPASATEIAFFCKETGFEVIDAQSAGARSADVILRGEGFSEMATRHGGLVSVKARLEVQAIDRITNKLIAVERQTAVVVDLSEQIAGKAALQQAAAAIAERLLPKLVLMTW
jgi:TolB-like protein